MQLFRKIFILFIVFTLIFSYSAPVYAGNGYGMMPQFLNELGLTYYQNGRYADALHEFKKALLLSPDNEFAKEYIRLIQEKKTEEKSISGTYILQDKKTTVNKYLDEIEAELPPSQPAAEYPSYGRSRDISRYLDEFDTAITPVEITPGKIEAFTAKTTEAPQISGILSLDEGFKNVLQPIEIEVGKSIIIEGTNFRKYLITQPAILDIEQIGPHKYSVTTKQLGYTYIHLWDDNGRWTISVLGTPEKPEGLLSPEERIIAQEKERNFKIRYSVDWSSFEEGASLDRDDLRRQTYAYSHAMGITGATPYGNFDSSLSVRSLQKNTDLTYLSLGLTEGRWRNLRDFSIRAVDYQPLVENLAFGSSSLRGIMLESPAFNKKIDYTLFWGREGGGRFGNLSPGLADIESKFLAGTKLVFQPNNRQTYSGSIFRGWGRDRETNLPEYAYDLIMDYNFDKWGFSYEIAQDSKFFSHLLRYKYSRPSLNFSAELRDIDKNFLTIVGFGSRVGELGGLFNIDYQLTPELNSFLRLDVFRDRLFPSAEKKDRLNQTLDFGTSYKLNKLTTIGLDYSLDNELGKISQFRSHNAWATLTHTFANFKRLNSFYSYQYIDVSNFSAPSLDYRSHKLVSGLRLNLISDLYYFINKEISWTREKATSGLTRPEAWETGVDWTGQINEKVSGNFRLNYRDEENSESVLSFLSGEDYLEGYTELNYRPETGKEAYISGRVRNIWADKHSVNDRIELDFRAGMRYVWDTGINWKTVGTIEGLVYKDYNSDGLRQNNEPPVEGVDVYIGNKKTTTDILGYYKFKNVKANEVDVRIDSGTIPKGYVLTVPAIQTTLLAHHHTEHLDFGIAANSEISGVVFIDKDFNGKFSADDTGLKDVVLTMENNTSVKTDGSGRYFFRKAPPGKHTITLDINSIPVAYLPEAAIKKELTLFEGMMFKYNIPLKEIND